MVCQDGQLLNPGLIDYRIPTVELKLAALSTEIRRLEEQWGCPFAAFQEQTKDEYAYEVESTLWEWEQLETLKSHYQALRERWS